MIQVFEKVNAVNSYEEERNKPMPSLNHSKLQRNLLIALCHKYDRKFEFLPEIAIKIGDWGATPDVGIFNIQNADYQHDVIKLEVPPLCAIEILSPTQSLDELIEKSEHYFLKGAKSYWLVLPKLESILVYEQPFKYTNFRKYETLIDNNLTIEIELKEVFK
jgi:Uma2 family endonuclease